MTINYGIIGCGMMGREHLRNINLLQGTMVAAIYEPDANMAQAAAALAPDAFFVNSVDELLDYQQLDCLVIASPNHCHIEQLEAISTKVTLPILVEKPLFTAEDDLARAQAVGSVYRAPIWVAMEYRYMPPMQQFINTCLLYTSPSPRDKRQSRMPSSA